MNETTLSAIDALIESFEKNTYTERHVESLLNYLVALDENEDLQTINAIAKVLGFCNKDFVQKSIIERLGHKDTTNHIKTCLLTACWESGLNYSPFIDVIVQAMLSGNERVAIEAYTVILECNESGDTLKKAIEEINHSDQKNYSPAHRILINDSLHHLIALNRITESKI